MEHSIRCAAKLVSISLETDKHIIEKCQAQSGVCDRPVGEGFGGFRRCDHSFPWSTADWQNDLNQPGTLQGGTRPRLSKVGLRPHKWSSASDSMFILFKYQGFKYHFWAAGFKKNSSFGIVGSNEENMPNHLIIMYEFLSNYLNLKMFNKVFLQGRAIFYKYLLNI